MSSTTPASELSEYRGGPPWAGGSDPDGAGTGYAAGWPARPRRWQRIVALLALAMTLTACGLFKRTRTWFGGKLPVEVVVAEDVNQNSPVAVDVVIIHKKKMIDKILEKSAGEWFAGREQFQRDFPDGYATWSWEWIPGQEVPLLEVPVRRGSKTAIVFADYFSAGQHRVRVDPRKPLRLELAREGFTVEEAL